MASELHEEEKPNEMPPVEGDKLGVVVFQDLKCEAGEDLKNRSGNISANNSSYLIEEVEEDEEDDGYNQLVSNLKTATCLKGHNLESFQTFGDRWWCNECGPQDKLPPGTTMWGCRECNDDYCVGHKFAAYIKSVCYM
eukprot:gene19221-937_t